MGGAMSRTRVLLAMSHPGLRQAFQELLEIGGSIKVVGAVGTGLATIEAARQLLPDVILIDIRLPDINGLEVTSSLVRELPSLPVVVLGDEEAKAYREAAIGCGAMAYLSKLVAPDKLRGTLLSLGAANPLPCPMS